MREFVILFFIPPQRRILFSLRSSRSLWFNYLTDEDRSHYSEEELL